MYLCYNYSVEYNIKQGVTQMVKGSRFEKGSGCFTCRVCGRRTRATGQGDNEHVYLCVECFEIAGLENELQDGIITQEEFDRLVVVNEKGIQVYRQRG